MPRLLTLEPGQSLAPIWPNHTSVAQMSIAHIAPVQVKKKFTNLKTRVLLAPMSEKEQLADLGKGQYFDDGSQNYDCKLHVVPMDEIEISGALHEEVESHAATKSVVVPRPLGPEIFSPEDNRKLNTLDRLWGFFCKH